MKGVNLVVPCDGFLCITESLIIHIFYRGHFDNRGVFVKLLIPASVYNGLNLTDDEVQWILHFSDDY